jgi:hypothetical protein
MSIPGVSTDIETVITPDTDTTIIGPIIGDAVTNKARGPLDSDFLVGAPLRIEAGETFRVPANQQVLFASQIAIEDGGQLNVSDGGQLIDVTPKATREWSTITNTPITLAGYNILDGVVTTDARLSDAREWTAETISQAEAEAGTETIRRAITAQRMRQSVISVLLDFGLVSVPAQFGGSDWGFGEAPAQFTTSDWSV